MKLDVIKSTSATKNTQTKVSDVLFDQPNAVLLAQAVRVYLSNQRQGTSKTKTRSEVSRTTKKWYRQKGTGGARHGAKDANIFVGGGVSHGPTGEENWKKSLTKVLKLKALSAAFTAQSSNVFINDELETLSGKTREAVELLEKIGKKFNDEKFKLTESKLLIVVDKKNEKMVRAVKNIPNITVLTARILNTLAVVKAHKIIVTSKALEVLEKRVQSEK